MNDGGCDGAGCFDIKEWADTTELTNVEVAGLGKCSYLVGKRKVFILRMPTYACMPTPMVAKASFKL